MTDQQLDLWSPRSHARRRDPETSHAAAESVTRSAKALMEVIWRSLATLGPATFSELADRTGLEPQQVWKRLSDLRDEERIEPSGLTRPGRSGRRQTVWRVVR